MEVYQDGDGWCARGIGDDLFTRGQTVNELYNNIKEADKFKNFPIWAWGFAIGSAIANLYAEWKAGKS